MQQPTPRRLTRGRDRMIGGVASGFAEYLNLDPTLVRVGWVVTGIFVPPAALLGYLLFLVIMPPAGAGAGVAPTEAGAANSASLLGIVLLAIGAMLFFGLSWSGFWSWGFMPHLWDGGWFWPARFIWPVVIVLVVVYLLTRDRRR